MLEENFTFNGAIDSLKSWADVKFSESEACELISHWLAAKKAPDEYHELIALKDRFLHTVQPQVDARLANTDWAQLEGKAIVLLSNAYINIENGMRHFLPSSISNRLSDPGKQILWRWYLLNRGIIQEPQNPYCLLKPSALLYIGGLYASLELIKRARKHPLGFLARLFLYFAKSKDGSTLGAEEVMAQALKRISLNVRKKVPAAVWPEDDEGQTVLEIRKKFRPSEVYIAETLLKKYSRPTPEEIVALAVDGLLNIASQAAANRMIDPTTSEQANFEQGIVPHTETLQEADDLEDITFTIEDYPGNPMITEANKLKAEIAQLHSDLKDFSREYPKHGQTLHAEFFDDIKQKDHAAQQGISDRAIRKRIEKALEAFASWQRAKYPAKFAN